MKGNCTDLYLRSWPCAAGQVPKGQALQFWTGGCWATLLPSCPRRFIVRVAALRRQHLKQLLPSVSALGVQLSISFVQPNSAIIHTYWYYSLKQMLGYFGVVLELSVWLGVFLHKSFPWLAIKVSLLVAHLLNTPLIFHALLSLKEFEMWKPVHSVQRSVEALSRALIYGFTNMSALLLRCKAHEEDYSVGLSPSIQSDRWQDTSNYQPPRINHEILSRSSLCPWWNNHFQVRGACPTPLNPRFVNLLLKPP